MTEDNKKGSLIISLDFEMMWGGIDIWTPDDYGKSHVEQVREVIKRLVSLFNEYQVHATFATVGLLMHHDKEEAVKNIPLSVPTYKDRKKSPYEHDFLSLIKESDEYLFFAHDIITFLKRQTNIEIGTHTYSHYYCWEQGQTVEQFNDDLLKAFEIATKNNIKLESIVFPRNEVSPNYLNVCRKYGIKTFRGNALKYFDEPKNKWDGIKYRLLRLIDAYINIGGKTTFPYNQIDLSESPINIRASRFLRPYSQKLSMFEWLRLRRIRKEMEYAAKHHEIYHLWWHPHNFGNYLDKNISFLEKVLNYYQYYNNKYGMQSFTMNELFDNLKRL